MTDDELFYITNKIENYLRKLLRNGEISREFYGKFMQVNMEMLEEGVDDDKAEVLKEAFSNKYNPPLKIVDSNGKSRYNKRKGSKKGK